MEFDIAYKADIDKVLAEKLDMDIEVVSENTKYLIKRLKEIMNDPKIAEVSLGKIGSFYVSMPLARYKLKRDLKYIHNLADKVENLMNYKKEVGFSKGRWWKMQTLPRIFNKFYTKGKRFKELEEIQNNAR